MSIANWFFILTVNSCFIFSDYCVSCNKRFWTMRLVMENLFWWSVLMSSQFANIYVYLCLWILHAQFLCTRLEILYYRVIYPSDKTWLSFQNKGWSVLGFNYHMLNALFPLGLWGYRYVHYLQVLKFEKPCSIKPIRKCVSSNIFFNLEFTGGSRKTWICVHWKWWCWYAHDLVSTSLFLLVPLQGLYHAFLHKINIVGFQNLHNAWLLTLWFRNEIPLTWYLFFALIMVFSGW